MVTGILEAKYESCIHAYTDGSTSPLRRTSTVACHIPELGMDLKDRPNHITSSTTVELSASWMALKVLLHPFPFRATILTGSRSTLLQLRNNGDSPFVRGAIDGCNVVEDAGWVLHLQWMPSHIGQRGNGGAESLATEAHQDDASSSFIDRFTDSRSIVRRIQNLRHTDPRAATGTLPHPLSDRGISCADASLLHRSRCDCAFPRIVL